MIFSKNIAELMPNTLLELENHRRFLDNTRELYLYACTYGSDKTCIVNEQNDYFIIIPVDYSILLEDKRFVLAVNSFIGGNARGTDDWFNHTNSFILGLGFCTVIEMNFRDYIKNAIEKGNP